MTTTPTSARFEVVRRLGAGGMGEVLLAWQLMPGGLSRLVVLKTILPHLVDTKQYVDLFVREARIGASLSHANLVQILDVTTLEGRPCIVMEFLRGIDVAQLLRRSVQRDMPPSALDLIAVIAQAADGLAYAHDHVGPDGRKRSIVHRDVSPQNLFLTAEGAVKVLDFGVARAAEDPRTQTGKLLGKFAYMAPEVLAGSRQSHSPSVDQFALGVMLWEGLTLRRLFSRPSPPETIQAVTRLIVPPPSAIAGSPPALDAVVLRALERDPARRFATCADFAAALRTAGMQLGASMTEATRVAKLVHDLAPETLGEITASGPSQSGPTWLDDAQNSDDTWAVPWEPEELQGPTPRAPNYVARVVFGVVALAGLGGAAAMWQATRPTQTISVSFEGLPTGAVVEVDGVRLSDSTFRGPPSDRPHRLRVVADGRELVSSQPTWLSDQVVMLTTGSSGAQVPAAQPDAGTDAPPPAPASPPTPPDARPTRRRPDAGVRRSGPPQHGAIGIAVTWPGESGTESE